MQILIFDNLSIYINDEIIGPRKLDNIIVAENIVNGNKMLFESIKDMVFIGAYGTYVSKYKKFGKIYKNLIFRPPIETEIIEYKKIVIGEPFKRLAPAGFKICGNPKCRKIKLVAEFNKWSKSEDGLKHYCRECQQKDGKRYHSENRDTISKNRYGKYHKDIDVSRRKSREYAATRREKIHECHKIWYGENKERKLEKNREWYKNNPDKRRKLGRDKARRRRERLAGVNQIFTKQMEDIVFEAFQDKCFNCGGTDRLCIDHHKPLVGGCALSLDNAVLLCIHCNSSKSDKRPEEFYSINQIEEIGLILGQMMDKFREINNGTNII